MTKDASMTSPTIQNWANDPSNAKTWKKFAIGYRDMLIGWCLQNNLKHEDAEDLSHEITLKMQDKIRTYSPQEGRFRPWLKRVTYNACMDYFRRKEHVVQYQHVIDNRSARDDLDERLDTQAESETLQIGLAKLQERVSTRDFEIFMALTFGDQKPKEVADFWGMPIGTVTMIKCRLIKKLRIILLPLAGDDDARTAPR